MTLSFKKFLTLIFVASCFTSNALAIHPDAPVCGGSDTVFTNSTETPIASNSVTTSTITVSGVNTFLWDVDLQTFIQHARSNDLDFTLMSPAGTIVTISTDNGGSTVDVFNGTVWDNSANPGGQAPYVTNNGLVTDHAYVTLTTAANLTPEESLAAFRGENPNGVWTLTISDDLEDMAGTLTSWSLDLNTLPATPTSTTTTFSQIPELFIPTGPAVVSSSMTVAGLENKICDLNVFTNLTHTFAADLDITVTSPAGTSVTLTTDNGAGNDNTFAGTLWDDQANPGGQVPYTTNSGLTTDNPFTNLTTATELVPEEPLAAFDGENPNGTWTITISDDLAGDSGNLINWDLQVKTCAETDTDGDTFGDTCDACPSDPAKQAPGVCGCGVADVDLNGNSITDCLEVTPTPAPTLTPTFIPEPISATPTVVASTTGLKYVELASSAGTGAIKASKVKVIAQGGDKVSIRSCFDFKNLFPKTANVYGVLRRSNGKVVKTTRVRRTSPCLNPTFKTVGSYEIFFYQTRFKQSTLKSKAVKFNIVKE